MSIWPLGGLTKITDSRPAFCSPKVQDYYSASQSGIRLVAINYELVGCIEVHRFLLPRAPCVVL